jgi:hypothetical protein
MMLRRRRDSHLLCLAGIALVVYPGALLLAAWPLSIALKQFHPRWCVSRAVLPRSDTPEGPEHDIP